MKIKAYILDLKWMCERKRMLWCKLNSDGSGWGEALCVFECNSWFCYSRVCFNHLSGGRFSRNSTSVWLAGYSGRKIC